MGNGRNAKKPKSSTPGRPVKKKKKDPRAASSPTAIGELDKPSHPKPRPWVRAATDIANTAGHHSDVPSDLIMASEALLGLARSEKAKRKQTESASEESEVEVVAECGRGNNMEVIDKGYGEDNEDESGSDSSDEEDEDLLVLDFLIPVDGAADSHTIDSNTSYYDFTVKVSDEMGVRRKDLNLAYKFTTSTQKELPQVLSSEEHLDRLFERAREELERHLKSKAKNKKPFKVILVDRDGGVKKKGKGKLAESKKASSKVYIRAVEI